MFRLDKNQKLKLAIVLLIFTGWILYRILFLRENSDLIFTYCFKDKVITDYINNITMYLSQNLQTRDYLLITGSKLLDMVLPLYMVLYVFIGNSWRSVFNIALFYNIRGPLLQNLFGLEYYDTYLFDNPGYFSFSVPYFRAPDFFYSGHAGCAILCAFQFRQWGYKFLFYFAIFVGFIEGGIMILLRTHYFIDIIFGMMAGHLFWMWAQFVSIPFDYLLPIGKRKEIKKVKENKKEN